MTRAKGAEAACPEQELMLELYGRTTPPTREEYRRLREARELDQLRVYLAYPRWQASEAVYILAGIDPELTAGGPGDWGLAWLPGGLRSDSSGDQFTLHQHLMMEMEDLCGFIRGDSRSPREWIEYARSKGYTPPWLKVAIDEGLIELPSPAAEPHSGQRAGALATRNASPQFQAKCELLAEWDKRSAEFAYADMAAFKREMIEKHSPLVLPKVSERTIGTWISDLKKERRSGVTCRWAAEIRGMR